MNVNNKGNDLMQTPPYLYNQLNSIFNFHVDAACTTLNCLAPVGFYNDVGCDGLEMSWSGQRIFCNPPFSAKAEWIKKAHDEVFYNSCPIVVMILPTNSMDSKPWHEFIYGKHNFEVLERRVSFHDPETNKPKQGNNSGTTIVYFKRKIVV